MEDQRTTMIMLGVIVVIASVMIAMFSVLIMSQFNQDDEYNTVRTYSLSGTITENEDVFECTGSGRTTYIDEGASDRIYLYDFSMTYSDSKMRELSFDIFCDRDGTPLDRFYTKIGSDTWSFTENGLTYEFVMERYCRVTSLTISGNGLSLKATVE